MRTNRDLSLRVRDREEVFENDDGVERRDSESATPEFDSGLVRLNHLCPPFWVHRDVARQRPYYSMTNMHMKKEKNTAMDRDL